VEQREWRVDARGKFLCGCAGPCSGVGETSLIVSLFFRFLVNSVLKSVIACANMSEDKEEWGSVGE